MKKLKNIFIVLTFMLIISCNHNADFFDNGIAYYTTEECVKSHQIVTHRLVPLMIDKSITLQDQLVITTVCDEYETVEHVILDYEPKDSIEINLITKSTKLHKRFKNISQNEK